MTADHEHQELFHLRKIINELDRLIQNGCIAGSENPVLQPGYWRNRINELLAKQATSGTTVAQASALLEKLERIADTLEKRR
ncbi:hypothetical protein PQQ52_19215 [Paraburkholderia sediminicola]|uniref:hypothetical protein n=1 Tax=Paraburkholderia sediminicola TaxID=458836 RepID=UPI0038B6C2DB